MKLNLNRRTFYVYCKIMPQIKTVPFDIDTEVQGQIKCIFWIENVMISYMSVIVKKWPTFKNNEDIEH